MGRNRERGCVSPTRALIFQEEQPARSMSRALCMIRRCLMFVRIIFRFHYQLPSLPPPPSPSFPGHPPSFLSSAIQNFVRPRFRRDHGNANWSVTAITPGRSSRKSVINFSALLPFPPPSTFPFPFQQRKSLPTRSRLRLRDFNRRLG